MRAICTLYKRDNQAFLATLIVGDEPLYGCKVYDPQHFTKAEFLTAITKDMLAMGVTKDMLAMGVPDYESIDVQVEAHHVYQVVEAN
jgi:hypothetical protein